MTFCFNQADEIDECSLKICNGRRMYFRTQISLQKPTIDFRYLGKQSSPSPKRNTDSQKKGQSYPTHDVYATLKSGLTICDLYPRYVYLWLLLYIADSRA